MGNARRAAWLFVLIVAGLAIAPFVCHRHAAVTPSRQSIEQPPRLESPVPPAVFVGEQVCASCHPRESAMWRGSHHQRAMQRADPSTVLGRFDGRTLTYAGITSRFFREGGKFMVTTDGPDGALHDYEIAYTLGVEPLQQYLVAFPGGRLQALEIAWDSRPRSAGGERWFHLYPGEKITSRDPLHWTGLAENWNGMCADCHSTNVRKAYAGGGSFATTYAEVSVSCEACHGPGSRHVAWARAPGTGQEQSAERKGLRIGLTERNAVAWTRDEATGKPRRSKPRTSSIEIEMCARCHSRRGLVHEDEVHGQRIDDDYRVALLDEDLYYADGQIRGEVYEYGSFLQSRMFAQGVTCGDCHEPHQPELRAASNGVCLQCHSEQAYHTPKHHFHRAGSPGSKCASCHMPAVVYMVVDPRRDHSFRVPRPDLSVKLHVPNACNGCHSDRSATWAAQRVEQWYGHAPSGYQRFAEALSAGTDGSPGAAKLLASVIDDRSEPAIARASALERVGPFLTPATVGIVRQALSDLDPLVRRAAARALASAEPRARTAWIAPLLGDAVRAVRLEAIAESAGIAPEAWPPDRRSSLEQATSEYIAVQQLNADRPEAHLSLALLYASLFPDRVEEELKMALVTDSAFVPAAVNLADHYRSQGREQDGETVLRDALRRAPKEPALLEALGLTMARTKRSIEALETLAKAARLAPGDARIGYVYAVALHDQGRTAEAIRELERVLATHPYDHDSLAALVQFHREAGNPSGAIDYANRLQALSSETVAK